MNNLEPVLAETSEAIINKELGETIWHRNWKEAFPANFRERTFLNRAAGYCHRADVHTPCGTTIEFQNSPITLTELKSREQFYPNLIWIVNGIKFKGFKVLKSLPAMDDPALSGFEFCHKANLTMVRKSDLLAMHVNPKIHTFHHPDLRHIKLSSNLYSFRWLNPHKVWFEAKNPIMIDLGGYFLYQLKQRAQLNGAYPYLELLPKKLFINSFLQ